mmetsp:Transcript_21832/g.55867  ORF Transcript_21832/g.55867 Transcript_21832/m.55867 type:complete len:92 (-) Transcript_21832:32-307(-)
MLNASSEDMVRLVYWTLGILCLSLLTAGGEAFMARWAGGATRKVDLTLDFRQQTSARQAFHEHTAAGGRTALARAKASPARRRSRRRAALA